MNGELYITVEQGDREVHLPFIQALTLARCMQDFADPVWHFNECGCCVTAHERANSQQGYLIGADGEYEWVTG